MTAARRRFISRPAVPPSRTRPDLYDSQPPTASAGAVRRSSWASAGADYLAAWLPAWLDDWLDLQRWDLLGELLVVDACLPRPTLDERAWEGFAAAQQPDGAMPALRTMPQGEPDEVFDVVYHPTLVAAFASVLATSRALTQLAHAPA
ncbi:hypothetical protein [Streptomyces sp. AC555_RSS877]|uniref:DUF6895 family protein n=1 Tax=Streptomyces sp. AC555_RSS877 TaxID=2823688 RepID=UPI0035ABB51D